MRLKLDQIAAATKGRIIHRGETSFEHYAIDSRRAVDGCLFFALRGEQTDGHLFVGDAIRRGATGAIVEQIPEDMPEKASVIQVSDTLQALQDLGALVRSRSRARFIGITGSSGKTSTKEYMAALLGSNVFKSAGNLNSLTGLPLALLSLENEPLAVLEVAMNHPGEIAILSRILRPDIGVLLNVNPVHLGQFHSVEAIADEKCALLEGMSEGSVLIFNADDPLISQRMSRSSLQKITFGSSQADLNIADVSMKGVRGCKGTLIWKQQAIHFETVLCGTANLQNIAAAVCVALFLDVTPDEIVGRIAELEPYPQRGLLMKLNGIDVYDDSYNSNPKALHMALQMAASSEGYRRKVAALGDMLELGKDEVAFHQEAGQQVADLNFDVLITAGPLSKATTEEARKRGMTEVWDTASAEEAAEVACRVLHDGDLLLVKGSRGMRMETVIQKLEELRGHRE